MEKIRCSGQCNECEAVLEGKIEDFQLCATMSINRRTFEQNAEMNKLRTAVENLTELFQNLSNTIYKNNSAKYLFC